MTSMRIFRIYQGEEHLQIGHLFFMLYLAYKPQNSTT